MSTAQEATGNLVKRRIGDIKSGPRVRRELSSQRIEFFMELYRSGASVPAIEIYRGCDEIRAGNHRRAALEKLGWSERTMEFKEVPKPRDYADLMVDAFADNTGDSLPPSYADSVYVIKGLLEKDVKPPRIIESFAKRLGDTYPERMVKGMIKAAKAQITQSKIAAALTDVRENEMTVPAAEEKHGLEKGSLKKKIGGKKKGTIDVDAIKKTVSSLARGHSRKVRTEIDNLLHSFEDGTADAASVVTVIAHLEKLNKRAAHATVDARQRLEKLGGPKFKDKAVVKAQRRKRARTQPSRTNSRRAHRHGNAVRAVSAVAPA